MDLLVSLAVAVALVVLFHRVISAVPVVFYLLAVAVDVVYAYGLVQGLPTAVWNVMLSLVQRCQLSVILLAIVMFIGAFPRESRLRKALAPIRGELSIIAALLAAGHVGYYLSVYLQQLLSLVGLAPTRMASLLIAIVLVVLLVVLTVTSLRAVKDRMRAAAWKSVQKLAYPFFGLIYVHVTLIFQHSLAGGSQSVWIRFSIYTAIFVTYLVCRIWRMLADRALDGR